MEPLLPEEAQGLDDHATDLIAKASALAGRINPVLAPGIGNLVRSMNCYYSNLIEGHPLASEGPSDSVRLGFPATIIDRWFPRLYVAPANERK
jgi:hypothetical protein